MKGGAMTDKELFEAALAAAENAYVPYSGFHVGAALLAEDGRVFTGCNVENSSYGACICAERTAVAKAVSEGCRKFKTIAVCGNGGRAMPCGICRQVLAEFGSDIRIVTGDSADELECWTSASLLPEAFKL